jgi:hypothetical protein
VVLESDRLIGFFMTGWSLLATKNELMNLVYVGLMVICDSAKGQGYGGRLFRRLVQDAHSWKVRHGESLYFWFHTATLPVAKCWWNIVAEIAPKRDGSCAPDLLEFAETVRKSKGYEAFREDSHPMMLRGVAKTRYCTEETERQRVLRLCRPDSLFRKLEISEAKGDRLLFVGRF